MENASAAVNIPLSLFQGLNSQLNPVDVPAGQSPENQDCRFLPGTVSSREGLHKIFATPFPNDPTVQYQKTFVKPNGDPINLYLDSEGILYQEDVNTTPGVYTTVDSVTPGSFAQSVTAFGREYMAFSDGRHGLDIPRQFDGANFDRVSQDGVGAGPTVGDSVTAGNISAGVHQVVVMFLTRQGYITAPSPPVAWTAAGGFKADLSNIPIGPSNVIARIVGFTGAGGANFFTILTPASIPAVVAATIIPNNTDTTATLDFTDNALFAATAIDIPGNNLFELQVLGPCLGVFSYASRMFRYGERNKVQNFLNMGFEGGVITANVPCGWTVATAGGELVTPGADFGLAWKITGDGTAPARGQITQPAFQDFWGAPILLPNTRYAFRLFVERNPNAVSGQLICDIYSPSDGVLATATITIVNTSTDGEFIQAEFDGDTPAEIPDDVVIRVYTLNQPLGEIVTVDELELIYADDPFLDDQFRVSYINNPESFDGLSGILGAASDPNPIRVPFDIRETMYFLTSERLHETADNGTGEPNTWVVRQMADKVGAVSFRGLDTGEDWAIWASDSGAWYFEGGTPLKVSQEIQPDWDEINQDANRNIWCVNDPETRRVYFGVPTGEALNPTKIYPMDYLEIATNLAVAGESNLRKWTPWNIPANCAAILQRPDNVKRFCIGAGQVGLIGYGNVYYLDELKLQDDDYGAIAPYYVTYFFIDPENAGAAGSHRKLAVYLTFFASGTGQMKITAYAGALSNPLVPCPLIPLSESQNYDLEIGLNVLSERVALKFEVVPVAATEAEPDPSDDVRFSLSNVVLTMRQDPWSPVRGAI